MPPTRLRRALRPFSHGNPWVIPRGPWQIMDHNFEHRMGMDNIFRPDIPFSMPNFDRPWHQPRGEDSGRSSAKMDKDGYKIKVDVLNFKPEEITVKNINDNVVVEGKHEETKEEHTSVLKGKHVESEEEHGYVSRHFTRRYVLPKGVDPKTLNSSFSSDGVLTITVPKIKLTERGVVRRLPIKHTGISAIKPKDKVKKK